jgi:hypothetical protein
VLFRSDDAFREFTHNFQCVNPGLFLKLCVAPAVAFVRWRVFLRRLLRNVRELEPLLREVFAFLRQAGAFLCLFEMQRELRFADEAIATGLSLLRECASWESSLAVLHDIRVLTSQAITADSTAGGRRADELLNLLRRLELQLSIWQTLAQTRRPFDPALTLLAGRASAVRVGAQMLLDFHVGYALEIADLPEPLAEICDAAVGALAARGRQALPGLFKGLTSVDRAAYARIVPPLLEGVQRRAQSPAAFLGFVRANVRGDEVKAMALVQLGFRAEALQVAAGNAPLARRVSEYAPTRA